MLDKVEHTFRTALNNWNAMSGAAGDEAESTAEAFEASFYKFIDALREWVEGLQERPSTLEHYMELPLVKSIVDRLPAPLYLNFETESELILDNITRIDEDKVE
ncbi:MAG: hypothetical protein K0R28_5687 [Paenibacillus sp.]|jgi:hypothetical protein|nr:hypothetical protein [Paenibacillus sp.]